MLQHVDTAVVEGEHRAVCRSRRACGEVTECGRGEAASAKLSQLLLKSARANVKKRIGGAGRERSDLVVRQHERPLTT